MAPAGSPPSIKKALKEIGKIAAARVVQKDDDLTIITANGVALRLKVSAVKEAGRATKGVHLIKPQARRLRGVRGPHRCEDLKKAGAEGAGPAEDASRMQSAQAAPRDVARLEGADAPVISRHIVPKHAHGQQQQQRQHEALRRSHTQEAREAGLDVAGAAQRAGSRAETQGLLEGLTFLVSDSRRLSNMAPSPFTPFYHRRLASWISPMADAEHASLACIRRRLPSSSRPSSVPVIGSTPSCTSQDHVVSSEGKSVVPGSQKGIALQAGSAS